MPTHMSLEIAEIGDIPFFSQDVYDHELPESARRLRAKIANADGILIATPEYNFSLPGVLKNAIDWASRGQDQVFQDKPVALVSATTGPLGGARVQYDVRRILGPLWAMVLPKPEVFIGNAAAKFDGEGQLIDVATEQYLSTLLMQFEEWISRVQRSLEPPLGGGR